MGISTVLSLFFLLTIGVHAGLEGSHGPSLTSHTSEAVGLPIADFSIPLSAKVQRPESKKISLASLRANRKQNVGDTDVLDGAAFDQEYVVNITVGGKYFNVILDTGSSDLWVVKEGFSCFDLNGTAVPASTCDFGPSQFSPADSPTFQTFPNVTFFVEYGSGEHLRGPAGFDTVTIGGLSVSHQEIGVPDLNAFLGDGVSEGVLGLAFPRLTSMYNSSGYQVPYDGFFLTAVAQKKSKTLVHFSISLDRPTFAQGENDPFDPNLGLLAFGGIAPVPTLRTATTVPFQGYQLSNSEGVFAPSNSTSVEFLWYTIDIDSYIFLGSEAVVTKNNNTILDTGTTLNILPTPVAVAFNARFDPPATLDSSGNYIVDCNATAPAFAVVIAGVAFSIDPKDQIVPKGDGAKGCWSGTQDGGPDVAGNLFILGDVFFHNVVTTFNPIAKEVTVTQRVPY
ncbi:acid protease [Mycena galericulata]|nr:acid protease [Mycena galericulata]